MKHLFLFTFFLHVFLMVMAQDELEALFHAIPPVPQNSVTHEPPVIQSFVAKCQEVEDQLMAILNRIQDKREEDFKPAMERTMKSAEIVAKMIELADKGELTDQKAEEYARQLEQYDEPESAPPSPEDAAVQNTINELRERFGQIERERMVIFLNPNDIYLEIEKLEKQYQVAKGKGSDLTSIRANLTRAWKERRRIYSAYNAEYLEMMHTMIRDNWSVLTKDQEQAAAILHHYAVDMKDFYLFYKYSFWEKYLEEYGLKDEDI